MISVVIPLYNKEKNIRTTLQSVLEQSYRDFELVVVNDGSTDGGVDIVQEEMVKCHNIRLINQKNKGVSAARNRGICEAKGDYVALIDGDDIWYKDCLKELVRMTQDFPDAAMCGVNFICKDNGKDILIDQGLPEGFRGYVKDYFSTSHNDLFCSSSVILKREKIIKLGLFDERIKIAEDLDLWYRIILNYPVAFYNKIYSCYNKDGSNRAEKIMNFHHEITHRIDYYIDKFESFFSENEAFARYISMRIASNILRLGYYFGDRHDRECTNHIVRYMPYHAMPLKYRFIFKTPRCIGWCVYQLSLIKKRIFREI